MVFFCYSTEFQHKSFQFWVAVQFSEMPMLCLLLLGTCEMSLHLYGLVKARRVVEAL